MIEAITTCVDYADYLAITLPRLRESVDRAVVVTAKHDEATQRVAKNNGVECLLTDAFYHCCGKPAPFNKGAAINVGLRALKKSGWILHTDADVLLLDPIRAPRRTTTLYTVPRRRVIGPSELVRLQAGERGQFPEVPVGSVGGSPMPSGYFQLWHWPTHPQYYEENAPDASSSDWDFSANWSAKERALLPNVTAWHLEMPDTPYRANWKGRRTPTFQEQRCGVITGANAEFWPPLRLLVYATRAQGVPIAIADHGLTIEQRRELAGMGADFIEDHRRYQYELSAIAKGHAASPMSSAEAWLKPYVCAASPFPYSIWIDADAIPLRDLGHLWQLTLESSWVSRDWWISQQHAHGLYVELAKAIYGDIPDRYASVCRINSGVFGFHREATWITEWMRLCERITSDQKLLKLCRCRDQSALIALLADHHPVELPRIQDDRSLNFPANDLMIGQSEKRKQYSFDVEGLDEISQDHPGARVVHWMGQPKPWMELQ